MHGSHLFSLTDLAAPSVFSVVLGLEWVLLIIQNLCGLAEELCDLHQLEFPV